MPNPDKPLPPQALEHIPQNVLDKHPELAPSNVHFNTTAFDVMTGTAGVKDYFVFDTELSNPGANLFNGEVDTINGFEPGVDVIMYTNFDNHNDRFLKTGIFTGPGPVHDNYVLGFGDVDFNPDNTQTVHSNYIALPGIPLSAEISPILVSGPFTWDLIT